MFLALFPSFTCVTSRNIHTNILMYFCPYFIDELAEAQRGFPKLAKFLMLVSGRARLKSRQCCFKVVGSYVLAYVVGLGF